MIQIAITPQEFMNRYNLQEKAHNVYIYAMVSKGIYGIPQAGRIAQDSLVKHMEPYGYHPESKTAGIWTHNSRTIKLTLLVKEFGVKYSGI